jgi:peptide/nickel transport system substrate-binding protein
VSNGYWDRYLSKRISRRRALAATGGTALGSALLIACGGGSGGGSALQDASDAREPGKVWFAENDWKLADETKEAVRGGIYRAYMEEDQAGHYDPLALPPSQQPHSDHVNEFLMARKRGPGIDPKSAEAALPEPALAQSFELAADGLSATFKMRPNVKWHPVAPVNGRTMDMDDWKTSVERFFTTSPQRVPLTELFDKAEYPDANTMVWRFKYPYAPIYARIWSERFAGPILPKELNANPQLAETIAIGTGYKILDKHERSITMEYRKHKDYWGGDPFIERWHSPIIPEYANQYAQFVNGNVIGFTPTARDVLILAKDAPQTVIVQLPIPDDDISRIRFGRQNQKTLPWKDPRVRIAMRNSMNMRGIGEFLANKAEFERNGIPVEVVTRTHVTRNLSYFLDPEKGEFGGGLDANYLYDVTRARQLLQASGFNNPIPLDYYVLPSGGEVPEQDQLVIDSMSQSGLWQINTVRSANTVAHRNCRSLGQCDGLVQSSTSEDVDHVIYRDYHSAGNTEGEQAYPDPRIDAAAEAQRRELDPAKRIEYIKEFQRVAAELMPTIPYIHDFTSFAFRWPWVHNYTHGWNQGAGMPNGRPVIGGHLQWLDSAMPNRDRGAT